MLKSCWNTSLSISSIVSLLQPNGVPADLGLVPSLWVAQWSTRSQIWTHWVLVLRQETKGQRGYGPSEREEEFLQQCHMWDLTAPVSTHKTWRRKSGIIYCCGNHKASSADQCLLDSTHLLCLKMHFILLLHFYLTLLVTSDFSFDLVNSQNTQKYFK